MHVLHENEQNDASAHSVRCKRKSEIQDGGLQFGNLCVSTTRQDCSEILTAIPNVLKTRNPLMLIQKPHDIFVGRKS
jgi:hypothetical protein